MVFATVVIVVSVVTRTGASITGAKMLLHLKLLFPQCQTLGDLGLQVLGKPGQIWGNIIQLGNFCLFMPCALRFCGLALKGVGNGIPGFDECVDYYVFVVAFVCLVTTQVRDFRNAQIFTVLSFCCVIGMIVSMLYASFKYDNEHKIPASWFGNPEPEAGLRLIRFAGGCTIGAWAFIPAFLTVELSTCMGDPADFNKSLVLAGTLNVLTFLLLAMHCSFCRCDPFFFFLLIKWFIAVHGGLTLLSFVIHPWEVVT